MEVMKRRARGNLSYSVFYEQAPEGGYGASVPALPGCRTRGETLEEAGRNVMEAIALYLESPGGVSWIAMHPLLAVAAQNQNSMAER